VLTARVRARSSTPSWSVPVAALTRHGDATLVFVRDGNEMLAQSVVVVGEDGARAFVSGVDASRRIAVAGVSALKALWLAAVEEGG
jgi:hypothetical protein